MIQETNIKNKLTKIDHLKNLFNHERGVFSSANAFKNKFIAFKNKNGVKMDGLSPTGKKRKIQDVSVYEENLRKFVSGELGTRNHVRRIFFRFISNNMNTELFSNNLTTISSKLLKNYSQTMYHVIFRKSINPRFAGYKMNEKVQSWSVYNFTAVAKQLFEIVAQVPDELQRALLYRELAAHFTQDQYCFLRELTEIELSKRMTLKEMQKRHAQNIIFFQNMKKAKDKKNIFEYINLNQVSESFRVLALKTLASRNKMSLTP